MTHIKMDYSTLSGNTRLVNITRERKGKQKRAKQVEVANSD